jgi:glycosyltransferase involved in cell wall biosynthesis
MTDHYERTVVFVTPGFSEPGGCASHGRKIAQGLIERGWSVDVVARLGSGRAFERFESNGLRVTEIPGFGRKRLGGLVFLMVATSLVAFRRRPHAFMAMQLSSPATVACLGALFHRNRRFLVFSTMSGPHGEVAFVRSSRTVALRRRLLGHASALIAQTQEAAEELQELVPQAQVEIVSTPVRLPREVPALKGDSTVVFTGRIVRQKNLEPLIRTWPQVLRDVPGARLTLVGSGTDGDPVEDWILGELAEHAELSETVTLTGWVDDVAPYLAANDVFVFPSVSEGMSNSLLEACVTGRIIVASNIPANRAVLGDSYPLLFEPHDDGDLLRALIAALTDKPLRAQARDTVLQRTRRFSDELVLTQIENLLTTE